MARPTTWFTPLERPPFVTEHRHPAGPPAGLRVLELSSRSEEPLGQRLSAMHLRAAGPDGDRGLPVESVYQAAKCYGAGGPDEQPLRNGFDAKRHDRERRTAGPLRGFHHRGTFWPAASGSAFYDRLWIQAALGTGASRELGRFDAYTDQFHRPGQAVACQARSAAMLVGLDRARELGRVHGPIRWADALKLPGDARPREANAGDMHAAATRPNAKQAPQAGPPPPGVEARVLVCGSRDFGDRRLLDAKLDEVRGRLGGIPMRVISGAARGADTLAADWARRHGVPCHEYPADWDRYGRSAGYRRNEQMLTEGRPHLVVAFPQGESRGTRMMMDIASRAKVAVEEIDPASRTTLTDTGKLHDVADIARRSAVQGVPAGPVEAPPVSRIAKLPNGEARTHGEARVVIGGLKAGADERLVHAKLDEVLARAHPAALRIAVDMQPGKQDLSTVAASWARRRGVHCDQYRTDDAAGTKKTHQRMIAEQKPHVVVTFPRGEKSAQQLAAAAARTGVPVEAVDASGVNHTRSGKLTDMQKPRQSRERPEPNEAWVVPIEGRTAAGTKRRLGARAADAEWARPGHACDRTPPRLNLRDRSAYAAVRSGAAVRIDRKTDWGNPFPLRDRNDAAERREVLEQYRGYLADAIDSGKVDIDRLAKLDGKALACHCAPQACHGDVLSQAATWAAGIERERDRKEQERSAVETAPGRTASVDTHVFDAGNGDWDDPPQPDGQVQVERPPLNEPQHPDDLAADRLESYRGKIASAGATENQLQAVDTDIATLRASAGQARADRLESAHRSGESRMPAGMRETLDEYNRGVDRTPSEHGKPRPAAGEPPPPPAPAPPPAAEPTREVRVLVTGSWRHDQPAQVYAKLDEVRERIAGAPMRIVTGDSRGAQASAAAWARDAGVPCDVHPTDWEAADARQRDDAARAESYDESRERIEEQYWKDAETGVPDPEQRLQDALDELDQAADNHRAGPRFYRAEVLRERDERMLADGKPHAVVSFASAGERRRDTLDETAAEQGIPCERVDHHGTTVTPEADRPDLRAIGRRKVDTVPDNPETPPAPAAGAWQATLDQYFEREQTHERAAPR